MDSSPEEDNFTGRLLHQAALWDNAEFLEDLLKSDGGKELVDARDSNGRTPLHAAACSERSSCLQLLLNAGADVSWQSDDVSGAKTALHIAAERGHIENVKALLEARASIIVKDSAGHTPLQAAERGGHTRTAVVLRDAADALDRQRVTAHNKLRHILLSGDLSKLKAELSSLGNEAEIIVNLAPGGASTLLYVASEMGAQDCVAALLAAGADGRCHPVTAYSPLYAACYRGHVSTVYILLNHFPSLCQKETVEKWLPIHVACIGGHAAIVTLLLSYKYPENIMKTYTDPTGKYTYKAAFDVNHRDVSGQTPLYVAATLGNLQVLEAVLGHTATVLPDSQDGPDSPAILVPERHPEVPEVDEKSLSSSRKRISRGIQSIMCRLKSQSSVEEIQEPQRIRVADVNVDCDGDTCLGAAVRHSHRHIVAALLRAGADVNASCGPPLELKLTTSRVNRTSRTRSTSAPPRRVSAPSPSPGRSRDTDMADDGIWCPLSLAVATKNTALAELLVRAGATDPSGKAIRLAYNTPLLSMLLAIRAYVDSEFKINKKHMTEAVFGPQRSESTSLTFNAVYPNKPTMVDWHDLQCGLTEVDIKWLRQAVMHVNTQLSSAATALHAITRIDISNNHLKSLPKILFTLTSLRFLNVSKNKLEKLPGPNDQDSSNDIPSHPRTRKAKQSKPYSAPSLNTIFLQDNRLETLPEELFQLPALNNLDVSNNKLRRLPSCMWRAPALTDLNASFNHLKDLPLLEESSNTDGTSPGVLLSPTERGNLTPSSSIGNINQNKCMSPSSSIDRSSCIFDFTSIDEEENICVIENREDYAIPTRPKRNRPWSRQVEVRLPPSTHRGPTLAPLSSLDLAHNALTQVPRALACLAPNLTRLSMSYNSLRSMSYVTSYPLSLRQLDLSHNEITCWPSLPQVESILGSDPSPLACYCPGGISQGGQRLSTSSQNDSSFRNQVLTAVCPARGHLRLENLRTLILANNLLTRIQLTTDDDGQLTEPPTVNVNSSDSTADEDDEWSMLPNVKSRLLFPHLSMLDVAHNLLRSVPSTIHELASLSVLNISGNKDITELPPQMGLLSRLWNLNTAGCPLHEPLRSMIESKKYKTMDIVGYLKSVLEDAQPYTRMKLMVVGVQGIGKTSLLEKLRQETTPAYKRRSADHWAKRMGNKTAGGGGKNRGNISTVGVDIATWQLDSRDSRGAITFRTWDFGGQQEYYATHQYFLSRRSLYVVAWRADLGRAGARDALRWLRTIHARAPNSPVILVATHYDLVLQNGLPDNESFESLQREIRARILCACDADKLGLPRVIDSIEVSCVTGHNIRLLADVIYDAARSLRPPGSKEPLLEQRIPASYLALEECVTHLAAERKSKGLEPVLRHDQFRQQVTNYMQSKSYKPFRDVSELHQAAMFLHENGVMLHYDDSTLKELYFLDPQWLCDMLAHVVTIREINPFARTGIMKLDDLAHVLKSSPLCGGGEESRALLVSLLNKFELALAWDGRNLIVPPLLPCDDSQTPLKVSLRSRPWVPGRWAPPLAARGTHLAAAPVSPSISPHLGLQHGSSDSPTLMEVSNWASVWGRSSPERAYQRLIVVSYIPPGFWSRLITRLLADESIADVVHTAYVVPDEVNNDLMTARAVDLAGSWQLWQTGATLFAGDIPLCSVRERRSGMSTDDLFSCYEANERFRIKQESVWCDLDVSSSTIVEICLPAEVLIVRRQLFDDKGEPLGCQNISVEANPEVMARLLAMLTDHVDLLLEDWYPSLGTRFVHTSEGRCLVTRAIPCPRCMHLAQIPANGDPHVVPPPRVRGSQDSRASDQDSGVGHESNSSSRLPSMEGPLNYMEQNHKPLVYSWSIEECILAACGGSEINANGAVSCPAHGDVMLANIAPDTLLLDFGACLVRWDRLRRLRPLGRGAFGVVLGAEWDCNPPGLPPQPVAVKLLQPFTPPSGASHTELQAYKAARSRWQRSPCAAAARAYCALRGEATLLRPLRHVHVPPLLGVCRSPLALLLPRAPEGALDSVLRRYLSRGRRILPRVARQLALQPARALEYLHARRILYRDLKAENVLVWSIPQPEESLDIERSPQPVNVHVKLGDYGISRLTLPCGAKGFGGTEGFMAPEIMKYNGEEEYTEKVDCFSYGMYLYEIVTQRQPFEGNDAIKESVLVGARPTLTPKDTEYPYCILETMWSCWNGAACARPSGSALVSLASAPEYVALRDVTEVARTAHNHIAADVVEIFADGQTCIETWIGLGNRLQLMLAAQGGWSRQHSIKIKQDVGVEDTPIVIKAVCTVGKEVWVGDNCGRISAYNASNCAPLWCRRVAESVCGVSPGAQGVQAGGVASMRHLRDMTRVAVAMEGGRLFLVCCSQLEPGESFVSTELGSAEKLFCMATVHVDSNSEQLWCGGSNGTIWWYSFGSTGVREADVLQHNESKLESEIKDGVGAYDVTLCTADPENGQYVFTYLSPGCIVHQWSSVERRVVSRLDCSKLVPCSESLKSICIEEHLSVQLCQVTSLACLGGKLYVGSSWGCVVVAEAISLRPITVFRPHEGQISSLLAHRDKKGEFWVTSVGSGYRSLISRYVDTHYTTQPAHPASGGSYALLWLGEHWAND